MTPQPSSTQPTLTLSFQFVLVNVVVAVLMKHLEESNKAEREGGSEGGAGTAPSATDTDFPKTDTEEKEVDEEEEAGPTRAETMPEEEQEKLFSPDRRASFLRHRDLVKQVSESENYIVDWDDTGC